MVYHGVEPELVAVINQRIELLEALAEPHEKRDLTDELDLSRSTVNRAVRQLESLGLVTREGDYHLTVAGRLVVDVFGEFTDALDDVVRIEALLSVLPADAPMALPMVRGAEVHWSSEAQPTEPVAVASEYLGSATRIRLLVPQITRPAVLDTIEQQVADDGTPGALVLSRAVVDYLRERDGDWLARLSALDSCRLRVADRLPYALGVLRHPDGLHAGVVVYDSEGSVRGFLKNERLRAYAWASAVFDDYYEAAEPLGDG